ncbi:hypothetical protein EJB05_14242, partial [Eragrostis curvula]
MAQPELNHDAVTEILLRFPPNNPACLVRATLVCKPWRRILKDPAFLDRYREFHRAPPLLGYLHNGFHKDLKVTVPCFAPTVAVPPFPKPPLACRDSFVVDGRHGRVLLHAAEGNFIVWNPVTSDSPEEVPKPDSIPCISYSAAVLCAITGCDHRNCHGGPFRVLILGLGDSQGPVHACVYSSEARSWGTPVSLHLDINSWLGAGAVLIGEELYYCILDNIILEYDFGTHRLSAIDPPPVTEDMYGCSGFVPIALTEDDGSLGLAITRGSSLHLWSRKVKPDGVVGWVKLKVIQLELEKLVPTRSKKKGKLVPRLIGSAQGPDVIFMRTDVGIFMFEFKSGQARKTMPSTKKDAPGSKDTLNTINRDAMLSFAFVTVV